MNFCSNCGAPANKELPYKCSQCHTEFWRNPRCCAGALVLDKNKVLMVKRLIAPWDGFWDIPGGYCEWNEHPKDCAIREVFEETGIKVKLKEYHGIWMEPTDHSDYGENVCVYYTAEPMGDFFALPDGIEIGQVKWFDINHLPEKIAFPSHIPDVLKRLSDELNPSN